MSQPADRASIDYWREQDYIGARSFTGDEVGSLIAAFDMIDEENKRLREENTRLRGERAPKLLPVAPADEAMAPLLATCDSMLSVRDKPEDVDYLRAVAKSNRDNFLHAHNVLREVEWKGLHRENFSEQPACPWCEHTQREGHDATCELADVLAIEEPNGND